VAVSSFAALGEQGGPRMVMATAARAPHRLAPSPSLRRCSINVTFTPNTSNRSTANLSVADNAPGSPQTVSLSGTGHEPPTPTPVGAYTVVVNVVGGGASHTLQVNLNVQQSSDCADQTVLISGIGVIIGD